MLAANRELTAAQCVGILQRTARPLAGASYKWINDAGWGRVDALAAVEEARAINVRNPSALGMRHEAHIFESDMGDCLLLEAASGELMLCDGGMTGSLRDHVRAELAKLRTTNRELALVYVSHIDNDHISGVLQLLEDEVEWRVFDHHQGGTNPNPDPIRPPKVPRPPVIKGILHNAFRDTKTKNNKAIENLLIAAAPALYATAVPELVGAADEMQAIAAGIPEALEVLGLVGTAALDIPVNKPPGVAAGAKLLFAGQPGDAFALGSMQFTLVGPTRNELTRLRQGWNTWVSDPVNLERIKKIRAELRKRIEDFSNGALAGSPYDLRGWNGIPDIKGVTAPNIASLMFMVEENGKRLLLTGDAQQDFILDGLDPHRLSGRRIGAPRRAEGPAPRIAAQPGREVRPPRLRGQLRVLRQRLSRQPGDGGPRHRLPVARGKRRGAHPRPPGPEPRLPLLVQHHVASGSGRARTPGDVRTDGDPRGRPAGELGRPAAPALQSRGVHDARDLIISAGHRERPRNA